MRVSEQAISLFSGIGDHSAASHVRRSDWHKQRREKIFDIPQRFRVFAAKSFNAV